ncbi:hypothetical protein E1091_05625 [Micromonospora fluostatini]|uniref:Uncharacterized protein n=1 Tax=Micromonospora fluostatini TaxID=1629071 RepID=A0ABY2DJA8_9ACTN|nr:hypothetical protein E1091_05625 [Micromonospora fluostatini]
MLGQAQSPLVSGDRAGKLLRHRWLAFLTGGLIAGSVVPALFVALAASLLDVTGVPMEIRSSALLGALLVFLAFDVAAARRGGPSWLGFSRQTPARFGHTFRRADNTALVWGLDIGTGVSTFRMTSATWLGLAAVFLGLVPALVSLFYGIGLAVILVVYILRKGDSPVLESLPRHILVLHGLQKLYIIVTAALALVLAVTVIA